jgi:hypothetical protein
VPALIRGVVLPPSSPLELLLPDGVANDAIVLGDACPSGLAPAASPASRASNETPVDLVVLAPSVHQRRDAAWIETAARIVSSRLSSNGLAYVLPSRASRVRRALSAGGLRSGAVLLHIPDLTRSRHLVATRTEAERYALSGQIQMSDLKRLVAAVALRVPRASALGPTGTVLRRDLTPPLAAWLFRHDGTSRPGSALLTPTADGCVLHRFPAGEPVPDAVAKVSARATDELDALRAVAPSAGHAGAHVPRVLAGGTIGITPFVLQSVVPGRSAAQLVAGRRLSVGDVQKRLAAWLGRWARATIQVRELGAADLERLLLTAARGLADPGRRAYLDYVEALCARAAGERCPLVSGHGDLTLANVLVDDAGRIGIVDWEGASRESLPLMDFFYAAVDAVAAESGYADRVGAFGSCFGTDGAHSAAVADLRRRLARELHLDELVQELSFHACWLHHAANEARRAPGAPAGPFGRIVDTIARDPGRYGRLVRAR